MTGSPGAGRLGWRPIGNDNPSPRTRPATTPNPDASAFVQVGASVGPDTTVCLIEAMKVFSEIKAETAGTIERILVTNGQSVEYGQPLFLVRPN